MSRHVAKSDGQATVEFALVLPLVLLIIVGGIQFGLAFNFWLDLNHVASESARWAVVDRLPGDVDGHISHDELKSYVDDQILSQGLRDSVAAANGIEACFIPVEEGRTTPLPGDALEVTIKAPFHLGFGLAEWAVDPLTLTGRSTMRIERAPSGAGWTRCA